MDTVSVSRQEGQCVSKKGYASRVWSGRLDKVYSYLPDFSPSFASFIKWTVKQANWVETYSACLTAHLHLHNIKQKRPVFIKRAKIW